MNTTVSCLPSQSPNRRGPVFRRLSRRAFSLVELVIVVVILAIIGAIAVPRMSRGASGAATSALKADMAVLRSAIDLYQTEHGGTYPGNKITSTGGSQAVDPSTQLTNFTDDNGNVSPTNTKSTTYPYGPYIRVVPPLPIGSHKNKMNIAYGTSAQSVAGDTETAWIYYRDTGVIKPNTSSTELDEKGLPYSGY